MAWEQGGKWNTLKLITILIAAKQRSITLNDIDEYTDITNSIKGCLSRLVNDGILIRKTTYHNGKHTEYSINEHFINDITKYIFEVPQEVKTNE